MVLFSGGQQWGETKDIEETFDYVKARVPSMVLATTAQNSGADVIAQAWAARHEVQVVMCRLDRRLGNRAGFARNDRMLGMNPVEAVVCSGSGIQMNLANRFPRSRSISPKCAVWIEVEIDEWINCLIRNGRR